MKSLSGLMLGAALAASLFPSIASASGWGHGGWGYGDGEVILSRPIGLFFEAPLGGYTLYAGQAGSGAASASDYSHINYTTPPAMTAQAVANRLRAMGIPLVPPETQFLGKNPRAADDVRLPVPRSWAAKEKDEDKPKDKEKEKGKKKGDEGDE